ncbi:hypothetical protein MANES_09G033900v8 [Manihot esculenta]|uniref:Uncharacterized protein n=1 Tax=Manihot esculenta TaxID=3983 RepID=A0A2C9V8Z4_MANES|nr:hypothetical protein MANES_09G033900v8 [Manihot esculenta]
MMKQTTLIFISYLIMLLAAFQYAQGDLNYCSKTDTFVGGSCGNSQCLLDFLGKYGASSMPKDCTCKPLGSNQRSCTCLIICKD